MRCSTATTVSARSARELISPGDTETFRYARRATCPCTLTGTEDVRSALQRVRPPCMRRRPMRKENIPISAPGTMTAWAQVTKASLRRGSPMNTSYDAHGNLKEKVPTKRLFPMPYDRLGRSRRSGILRSLH